MKFAMPVAAVIVLSLTGCGSITRGTSEIVYFQSEPSGAAVTTDIGLSCPKTPCTLDVPRNKSFIATATLGKRSDSVRVSTVPTGKGNASMAGNLIVGGVVGIGVDAMNGANKDHKPNPVVFHLK